MATHRARLYRPGLDYRRRPGTADRDGAPRLDRIGIFSRALCAVELCHQHRATIPLPDYTNRDISEEPVYGLVEGAVSAEASSGG